MGYDMYFKGKHYTDGEEIYFRLNIHGMGWCVDEMAARGMVFDAGQPPAYPMPDSFGLAWELVEAVEYPEDCPDAKLTDEQREAVGKYLAERDAVLAWHGPEVPGIPVHKFGTNDGWLVLPAECEAAVRLGRQSSPPAEYPDIWAKWLDYLERASRAGGFEVR